MCLEDKYLLDQTEVLNELSLSLSQLIDHLQKSQNYSTTEQQHLKASTDNSHMQTHTCIRCKTHRWTGQRRLSQLIVQ